MGREERETGGERRTNRPQERATEEKQRQNKGETDAAYRKTCKKDGSNTYSQRRLPRDRER